MTAVPPPPRGGTVVPAPPPFGWITDPDHITGNELLEIQTYLGHPIDEIPTIMFPAWLAVAYARRHDPDAYPWSIALSLPLLALSSELAERQEQKTERQEQQHAEAVAAAIEAGEDPALVGPS